MSSNTNPIHVAKQAEHDLNTHRAKQGHDLQGNVRGSGGAADSTLESGIDDSVTARFPGSTADYGSSASGVGDNREIPLSEGGDINRATGKLYKARDYEGAGGPGDKEAIAQDERGGDDRLKGNVR